MISRYSRWERLRTWVGQVKRSLYQRQRRATWRMLFNRRKRRSAGRPGRQRRAARKLTTPYASARTLQFEAVEPRRLMVGDIAGAITTLEGNTYLLDLVDSDPTGNPVLSWSVNWGDGVTEELDGNLTQATHVYDGPAQVTVTASATDAGGAYGVASSIELSVENINPVITLNGDESVIAGHQYQLSVDVQNPGNDTITSIVVNWGDGTSDQLNLADPHLSHVYATGAYTRAITTTVTDGDGEYSLGNKYLDIYLPLTATAIVDADSWNEGCPFTLSTEVVDSGYAGTHTYSWQVHDPTGNVVATSTDAEFEFTPIDSGEFMAVLTVTNGLGDTSTDNVPFIVDNVAPVVEISCASSAEEGDVITLTANVSDAGSADTFTYYWLIRDQNGLVLRESNERTWDWQLADDSKGGNYQIQFIAYDDDGGVSQADVAYLHIVNVAPTVTGSVSSATISLGETVILQGSAFDPSPTDVVSYYWSANGPSGGVSIPSQSSLVEFTPGETGDYTLTFYAVDSDGDWSQVQLTLSVLEAVACDLTASSTTGTEGDAITLGVSVSDEAHPAGHTYLWQLFDSSSQLVAESADPSFVFEPANQGIYIATVTVTNEVAMTATSSTELHIENAVPVPEIQGLNTGVEGQTLSYSAGVTDAGVNDEHTYLWEVYDFFGSLVASGDQAAFDWCPADNGSYTVQLTVSDELNTSDTAKLNVSVTNAAPAIEIEMEGTQPRINIASTFTADVTDHGTNDSHSYIWSVTTPDSTIYEIGYADVLEFTPTAVGTYTLKVVVVDSDLESAEATYTFTACGPLSAAAVVASLVPCQGKPLTLTSNVVNPGYAGNHAFSWEVRNSNNDVVATSTDQEFEFTPSDNSAYTATLLVSNDLGEFVADVITFDVLPEIVVSDIVIVEGNSGVTNAVFTITLSGAAADSVVVTYNTDDDSAIAPLDYHARTGTITFAPGVTSRTITVPVKGDTLAEGDETLLLNLTSASGAAIADSGQAVATILDDDAMPTIHVGNATLVEGNSGTTNLVFQVTLSSASGQTITATYATSDGSAAQGEDYTAQSGTLIFAPGVVSLTVTIAVHGDLADELDEQFHLTLSDVVNAQPGTLEAVGTIVDNDAVPTVSVSNISVNEADGVNALAVITVNLSGLSGREVTVPFSTANGTALAGEDYDATSGTLTFSPGTTSQTVTVLVRPDQLDELNETFRLNLGSAVNAMVVSSVATVTIVDTTPAPEISISDATVFEGDQNSVDAVFELTLSAASAKTVYVTYSTADGSGADGAKSALDYAQRSGTLTFLPGVQSQLVTLKVRGDVTYEFNEQFAVNLTAPVNATFADAQAAITILDNDAPPTVSIGDLTVLEGNSGTHSAIFTVTLSAPSGKTVVVYYNTVDDSASAGDYIPQTGTLSFAPGITSCTVTIALTGDTLDELNETFQLNLYGAEGAELADTIGICTIYDNDLQPTLAISDVQVSENSADAVEALFTVSLIAASGQEVTVAFTTVDATAVEMYDYAVTQGTLTFAPGVTSQTVTVYVMPDALDELAEGFAVRLSSATNATLADAEGTAEVLDDNDPPTVSISDTTVQESNAGPVSAMLTVTLSAPSGREVTVNFATSDGTAGAADYVSRTGVVTFAPGETSQTITIAVRGDLMHEFDEAFNVELQSASGATIDDGDATVTIYDNDVAPTISIAAAEAAESDTNPTTAVFTVGLSAPSGRTVTVVYTTSDDTALAGSDYSVLTGTLTFAPGVTSQQITVTVLADTVAESSEVFNVELTSATDGVLLTATASGTIFDSAAVAANAPPTINAIANQSVAEGALLTFAATGNDPDSVTGGLRFSLDPGAPVGATITEAGLFVWRPSSDQAGGSYTITVRVTDLGTPARSATTSFTVTVTDVNEAPVIAHIENQTISEGQTLSYAVVATDSDEAASALTYSLEPGAPEGATISPVGVISWTASEDAGGNSYTFTVCVTDHGSPALSATRSFVVHVNEIDSAPVMEPVENQSASEGSILTFAVTANDEDSPGEAPIFSLDPGAPFGASISASGVFSWTPGEGDGGNAYQVTIRVTDGTNASLSSTQTVTITVAEVNQAPVMTSLMNQTVTAGQEGTFTAQATDADAPANTLTFSLDAGAPAGASISADGVFTWTPTIEQGSASYTITVRATDNGSPALSVAQTVTINVLPAAVAAPSIEDLQLLNDTGVAGDRITSDASLAGSVTRYAGQTVSQSVQYDLNGDGLADGSVTTANGQFVIDLAGVDLPNGPNSIQVRAGNWNDELQSAAYGTWKSTSFTYVASDVAITPPSAQDLALATDTGAVGDNITSLPIIVGRVAADDLPLVHVPVQFDLNGDGSVDGTAYSDSSGSGEFRIDLRNCALADGPVTISVRAGVLDPTTQQFVYGNWVSLSFTYDSSRSDINVEHQSYLPNRDGQFYWFGALQPEMGIGANGQSSSVLNYVGGNFTAFATPFNLGQSSFSTSDVDNYSASTNYVTANSECYQITESIVSTHTSTSAANSDGSWTYDEFLSTVVTVVTTYDDLSGVSYVMTQSSTYTYTFHAQGDASGATYTLSESRQDDVDNNWNQNFSFNVGGDGEQNRNHTYTFEGHQEYTFSATGTLTVQSGGGIDTSEQKTYSSWGLEIESNDYSDETSDESQGSSATIVSHDDLRNEWAYGLTLTTTVIAGVSSALQEYSYESEVTRNYSDDNERTESRTEQSSGVTTVIDNAWQDTVSGSYSSKYSEGGQVPLSPGPDAVYETFHDYSDSHSETATSSSNTSRSVVDISVSGVHLETSDSAELNWSRSLDQTLSHSGTRTEFANGSWGYEGLQALNQELTTEWDETTSQSLDRLDDGDPNNQSSFGYDSSATSSSHTTHTVDESSSVGDSSADGYSVLSQHTIDDTSSYQLEWSDSQYSSASSTDASDPNVDRTLSADSSANSSGISSRSSSSHEATQTYPDGSVTHTLTSSHNTSSSGEFGAEHNRESNVTSTTISGSVSTDTGSKDTYSTETTGSFTSSSTGSRNEIDGAVTASGSDTSGDASSITWTHTSTQFSDSKDSKLGYEFSDYSSSATTTAGATTYTSSLEASTSTSSQGTTSSADFESHVTASSSSVTDTAHSTDLTDSRTSGILITESRSDTSHTVTSDDTSTHFTSGISVGSDFSVAVNSTQSIDQQSNVDIDSSSNLSYSNHDQSIANRNVLLTHTTVATSQNSTSRHMISTATDNWETLPQATPIHTSSANVSDNLTTSSSSNSVDTVAQDATDSSVSGLTSSLSKTDTKTIGSESEGSDTSTYAMTLGADGAVSTSTSQTRHNVQSDDVTSDSIGSKNLADNRNAQSTSTDASSYQSTSLALTTHTSDLTSETNTAPGVNTGQLDGSEGQDGYTAFMHLTSSTTTRTDNSGGGTMVYSNSTSTAHHSQVNFDDTKSWLLNTVAGVTEMSGNGAGNSEETGLDTTEESSSLEGTITTTVDGVTTTLTEDSQTWNNSNSQYTAGRHSTNAKNNAGQTAGVNDYTRSDTGTFDRGGEVNRASTKTDNSTPNVVKSTSTEYTSTSSDTGTFSKSASEQGESKFDGSFTNQNSTTKQQGGALTVSVIDHEVTNVTDNTVPGTELFTWKSKHNTSEATTTHTEGVVLGKEVRDGVTINTTQHDDTANKADHWTKAESEGFEVTDTTVAGRTATKGMSQIYTASGVTTTVTTEGQTDRKATDGTSSTETSTNVHETGGSQYENKLHWDASVNDTRHGLAHTFTFFHDYTETGTVESEGDHTITTVGNQRSESGLRESSIEGTFVADASARFEVDVVLGGRAENTTHEQIEHRSGTFTASASSDKLENSHGPSSSSDTNSRSESGNFNWSDTLQSNVTVDLSAEGITRTASTEVNNTLTGSGTFTSFLSTTVAVANQAAPDTIIETKNTEEAQLTWDKSTTQTTNSANAVDLSKVTSYTSSLETTDKGSGTYTAATEWTFHRTEAGIETNSGASTLDFAGAGTTTFDRNVTRSGEATDNLPDGATVVSSLNGSSTATRKDEYSYSGAVARESDGGPVVFSGWSTAEHVITGETTSSEASSYEYDRTWDSAEDVTHTVSQTISNSTSNTRTYDETQRTDSTVAADGKVTNSIDLVITEDAEFTWNALRDQSGSTLDESVAGNSLFSEARDKTWTTVAATQHRELDGDDTVEFTQDREQGQYRMSSVENTIDQETQKHKVDDTNTEATHLERTDTTSGTSTTTTYDITRTLTWNRLEESSDEDSDRSSSSSKTTDQVDVLQESRAADGTGQIVLTGTREMTFETQLSTVGRDGPGSKYNESKIEHQNASSTLEADIQANGETTLVSFDLHDLVTTEFTDHSEIQTATVDFIQDNVYTSSYSQVAILNNSTIDTTFEKSNEWVRTGHMATNDGNGNVTFLDLAFSPGPVTSDNSTQDNVTLTNYLTTSLIAGNWSGILELGESALVDEVLDALGDTWTDTEEFGQHPGADPTKSPVKPNDTNPAAAAVFYNFGADLLDDFLSPLGVLSDWWSIR